MATCSEAISTRQILLCCLYHKNFRSCWSTSIDSVSKVLSSQKWNYKGNSCDIFFFKYWLYTTQHAGLPTSSHSDTQINSRLDNIIYEETEVLAGWRKDGLPTFTTWNGLTVFQHCKSWWYIHWLPLCQVRSQYKREKLKIQPGLWDMCSVPQNSGASSSGQKLQAL